MDPDERDAVAAQFGASSEQVERDHLISHLLAFLSRTLGDRIWCQQREAATSGQQC